MRPAPSLNQADMYRIALINMPFAALNFPSLALTQLEQVVEKEHTGRVRADVHYLHHEFGQFIGIDDYQRIANSGEHFVSGLGDWLFRQVAFPDAKDNTDDYLLRYYPRTDAASVRFKRRIREVHAQLEGFLERLIDEHDLDGCQLIGLTSMFSQHAACLAMARLIKRRQPQTCVVIGGANCEWPMGAAVAEHVEAVDYVFSGHALRSFPALVGHLLDGRVDDCLGIDGVFCRRNRDRWPTPDATDSLRPVGRELDLDEEVPLDYEAFFTSFERHHLDASIEPFLMFETSRGCWWGERAHCTFCGLNGQTMGYRAMSPERALREFHGMFESSPRCTRFLCVDNILPKSYLTDVFPHVDPPKGTVIFYEVKADLTDDDLATLGRAGVRLIQPGVEALATSTLKLMRKGTTSFQNLQLLKSCLGHDVFPVWNLLVGFPGETADVFEKYERDLPQLVHLPPPNGVHAVRFDRFSPYFFQAETWKLDLEPYDFYGMTYPFGRESIRTLAYYFMDRNYAAEYAGAVALWIGPLRAAVERWRKAWREQQPLPPQLYLERRDQVVVVHDTRFGEAIDHRLSSVELQLLMRLERPQNPEQLRRDLAGVDVDAGLRQLRDRKLLFEEGDRLISLVLGKQPPLASYYATRSAVGARDDGGFDPRRSAPSIDIRLGTAAVC